MMRIAVALCLACLCAGSAAADDAAPDDSFLSRVALYVPVYTRHVPHDAGFNDHNWGLFAEVAIDDDWSVAGGDFTNSYYRNTAFIAGRYSPRQFHVSHIRIDPGLLLGADLNGGYKGHSPVDPLMGAGTIKITGDNFGGDSTFLNRTGVLLTAIPGENWALNLALSIGL